MRCCMIHEITCVYSIWLYMWACALTHVCWMMYCVLWLMRVTACVSALLSYVIIVAGCITLGQINKSSAGCISLKVLEHDGEHNKVH